MGRDTLDRLDSGRLVVVRDRCSGCIAWTGAERGTPALTGRWSDNISIAEAVDMTVGITESNVFLLVKVDNRRSPLRILTMDDVLDDDIREGAAVVDADDMEAVV